MNDPVKGKELLAEAVRRGGRLLDSYDGNHGFYVSQGFEPVSWCKWDDRFKPEGWDDDPVAKDEDIIFYKYVGLDSNHKSLVDDKLKDLKQFKKLVKAGKDYDMAKGQRDEGNLNG